MLLTSLRDHDDFGSAVDSSPALKNVIIGLAVYGEGDNSQPVYSWGTVPVSFDLSLLADAAPAGGGRFVLPNKKNRSFEFIMETRRGLPSGPPINERRQGHGDERPGPPDNFFLNALRNGKYFYLNIRGDEYWRTMNATAIVFPVGEILFLFLVFYIRGLFLRNIEYRERIKAQENLVVLGTAASTLAHEIKNPLLAMRLQTEILRKTFPGEHEEELGIINEEIDRLSALTYRVNDYLREAKGSPARLNVTELLEEISRRLCGRSLLTQDSVKDAEVYMDVERARSVFENLIRNAMESGGPEDAISVSVEKNNGHILIKISDQGKGISSASLKRVFDPFFTSKSTGTGIGLSICRRFVEAAGGSIELASSRQGGAVARVSLPAYSGDGEEAAKA